MDFNAILNGTQTEGTGLLALLFLAIVLVIYLAINKNKKPEEEVKETVETTVSKKEVSPLDVNDEDAVVASLIASIECRNEYHKNVQVISVRKVN